MASYHIKEDGNPGLCTAEKGNCPKGGAHFESEETARLAVEELFGSAVPGKIAKSGGDSLPVYTKAQTGENLRALFDEKGDDISLTIRHHPLIGYHTSGFKGINDVKNILMGSRLDVKAQNARARQALLTLIDEHHSARVAGVADEERLNSAATMAAIMPLLENHYGLKDPRSIAQAQADRAYLDGYRSDEDALKRGTGSSWSLGNLSNDELEEIESLANKTGGDLNKLTPKDLARLAELNPRGNETPAVWRNMKHHPQPTAVEKLNEIKILEDRLATVPEDVRDLLREDLSVDALAQNKQEALEQITSIRPTNVDQSLKKYSLFDVAERTLNNRASNKALEKRVLEA